MEIKSNLFWNKKTRPFHDKLKIILVILAFWEYRPLSWYSKNSQRWNKMDASYWLNIDFFSFC